VRLGVKGSLISGTQLIHVCANPIGEYLLKVVSTRFIIKGAGNIIIANLHQIFLLKFCT